MAHDQKIGEQNAVAAAYGSFEPCTVEQTEARDFVVRHSGRPILGIEVTDFFHTESDARIAKIPGYTRELIESRAYRHKDDLKQLRVEEVVYRPRGDKARSRKIMALIRDVPPMRERLAALDALIARKAHKAPSYTRKAPDIDLLVDDPACAFRFDSFAEFYNPLTRGPLRSRLCGCPFREVLLVTGIRTEPRIVIPMKATVFVETIIVCQHLYKQECGTPEGRAGMRDFFACLFQVLSACGFSQAVYRIRGDITISFASMDVTYGSNVTIESRLTDPPKGSTDWRPLSQVRSDVTPTDRERADMLLELVNTHSSVIDLSYKELRRRSADGSPD